MVSIISLVDIILNTVCSETIYIVFARPQSGKIDMSPIKFLEL